MHFFKSKSSRFTWKFKEKMKVKQVYRNTISVDTIQNIDILGNVGDITLVFHSHYKLYLQINISPL